MNNFFNQTTKPQEPKDNKADEKAIVSALIAQRLSSNVPATPKVIDDAKLELPAWAKEPKHWYYGFIR